MRFSLQTLKPGVAYIGATLFLPRSHVAERPIRTALTFGLEAGLEPREMVRVHPHHLEVPRNYLTRAGLEQLGIENIVDIRPREYASSSLRPKPGFCLLPHQEAAWDCLVDAAFEKRDGVLRLDTGRGKTTMGLLYSCLVGGRLLVISAQEAHLKSWEKEIARWFTLDGPVGWIMGDRMEHDRDVVFSTIQTLVKRHEAGDLPLDFHERFALTIYDEVHHQGAEWFAKGSDLTSGQRLGLTATLKRRDRCEGIVLYQIGPVLYNDPSEDALVPSVHMHNTETAFEEDDEDICDVTGMPNVSKLRGALGRDEDRNRIIVDVIKMRLAQGHKVYVASHSKEHVFTLLGDLGRAGITAGVITGEEKNADKRLQQLNSHDCVVVTLAVGKENYNRPELSALVMTTPLAVDDYAPTEFVQAVGRILRPLKGKLDPVVDLFADRGVRMSFGMLQTVLRWCKSSGWKIRGDAWTERRRTTQKKAWRA